MMASETIITDSPQKDNFSFEKLNNQLRNLTDKVYYYGDEEYAADDLYIFTPELKRIQQCASKCYSYAVSEHSPFPKNDIKRLYDIVYGALSIIESNSRDNARKYRQLIQDTGDHISICIRRNLVNERYIQLWWQLREAMGALIEEDLINCIRAERSLEEELLRYKNDKEIFWMVFEVMKETCLLQRDSQENRPLILETYEQMRAVLAYPDMEKINACADFAKETSGKPSRCGGCLGSTISQFCLVMTGIGLATTVLAVPLAVTIGLPAVAIAAGGLIAAFLGYAGFRLGQHLIEQSSKKGLCEKLGLFADTMQRRRNENLETAGEFASEGIPLVTLRHS